ncbi:MAG: glycosyltransferase, partial [Methyloprofundus sp.]|nr:glycosyltransferase [Methyloprofundus sp.]
NQMAQNYKELEKRTVKTAYLMSKFLYKLPKKIIAVSEGVKNSITKFTWVGEEEVDVIYNPVVSDELLLYNPSPRAGIHPYFSENSPVFVCVGSLTKQKNFPLFLRAFRIVLNKENVNALILGEGAERDMLQDIISDLNLEANVQLPGFVNNPYDFIANADTFVLSSSWEGLPTVLIESLALSTNIVSTNCPSGPEEILESGKYGIIVELDDVEALAAAMIDSLTNKKADLKLRAQDFSISKSIFKYSSLIN